MPHHIPNAFLSSEVAMLIIAYSASFIRIRTERLRYRCRYRR